MASTHGRTSVIGRLCNEELRGPERVTVRTRLLSPNEGPGTNASSSLKVAPGPALGVDASSGDSRRASCLPRTRMGRSGSRLLLLLAFTVARPCEEANRHSRARLAGCWARCARSARGVEHRVKHPALSSWPGRGVDEVPEGERQSHAATGEEEEREACPHT